MAISFEDFMKLPDERRWRALYNAVLAPPPPAPRFDVMLFGQKGISWASECDAGQLDWHMNRCRKSIESGGPHADKDRKKLEKLTVFRVWRERFPNSQWVGKRGDEEGTRAALPSPRPAVYPRTNGAGKAPSNTGYDSGDVPFE